MSWLSGFVLNFLNSALLNLVTHWVKKKWNAICNKPARENGLYILTFLAPKKREEESLVTNFVMKIDLLGTPLNRQKAHAFAMDLKKQGTHELLQVFGKVFWDSLRVDESDYNSEGELIWLNMSVSIAYPFITQKEFDDKVRPTLKKIAVRLLKKYAGEKASFANTDA